MDNRVRPVEKILTVRRPWASAIFRPISLDPKSIENRSWPIPERFLGIRIGIHAGLSVDPVGVEQLGPASVLEQDRGKILGTVVVTGCHLERGLACQRQGCASNWWAQFSAVGEKPVYHWELEHPHPFVTPFEARGALGLRTPTSPTVIHRLEIAEIAS